MSLETPLEKTSQIKKIIHLDMDCFFAAVEMRDNPSLKGHPVAIGAPPSKRGVLSTCNYEARKYGLGSAMSSSMAIKKCPHLILIPGRHHVYKEVSNQIMGILAKYDLPLEVCSLDEAYMDATQLLTHNGSATLLARDIKKEILKQTQLNCSIGIAPIKFLAKIASDWNKPNAITCIGPKDAQGFIDKLSVGKIPGVGPATQQKLTNLGIHTCFQLKEYGEVNLIKKFGKFGHKLFEYSNGIDNREVKTKNIRKSLSCETTFDKDLEDIDSISQKLNDLYDELMLRLFHYFQKRSLAQLTLEELSQLISGIFVKIKFGDFKTTTVSHCFSNAYPTKQLFENKKLARKLLLKLLQQGIDRSEKPVRLIGLGVRFNYEKIEDLSNHDPSAISRQMNLFEIASLNEVINN